MKNAKKLMKKNGGFTLIELIVVIAILGILMLIAVPSIKGYTDKAKDASNAQYQKIIENAFTIALASNDLFVTAGQTSATVTIKPAATAVPGTPSLAYSDVTNLVTPGTAIGTPSATAATDAYLKTVIDPTLGSKSTFQSTGKGKFQTLVLTINAAGEVSSVLTMGN